MSVADDVDCVGELQELRKVRADHQDSRPVIGQLFDKPVDFRFCADVHTAGGLIQHHHGGTTPEPLSNHNLLLVSTAVLPRFTLNLGRAQPHSLSEILGKVLDLLLQLESTGGEFFAVGQVDVFRHRHGERETVSPALFGDVSHTSSNR
ncbi:MAG: Uncharacterised protein [Cellulomonadaceae bacterium TMED98]|nr:MAG: Uncharacterised protein [Cellulomonadaceae bacterium TMED98]